MGGIPPIMLDMSLDIMEDEEELEKEEEDDEENEDLLDMELDPIELDPMFMPPMSPPPEMNHKVQKTEDYVPPSTSQTAEATVLLKVKEGDEYKLALNMQQYSPEDITIKLNGQELTVEANAHGEKFKQSHVIPDNINLDEMSSSFSSDGVLVVKAPKK